MYDGLLSGYFPELGNHPDRQYGCGEPEYDIPSESDGCDDRSGVLLPDRYCIWYVSCKQGGKDETHRCPALWRIRSWQNF